MESTEIVIKYEKHPEYIETFITDFYGGISSLGHVKMFLVENTLNFPDEEVYTYDDSGVKLKEIRVAQKSKKVVKCAVNFSAKSLPEMIKWMQNTLETYNKQEGEKHE